MSPVFDLIWIKSPVPILVLVKITVSRLVFFIRRVLCLFISCLKGQSNFSQASYSVFKDFSNLASNLRRYSRFFIDSPLLFIAESECSPYCLIRRVETLRFIIAGSHYLLELSA